MIENYGLYGREFSMDRANKMKSGRIVYLCFSTDFLVEETDGWWDECWQRICERPDLYFCKVEKLLIKW